MPNNRGSDFEVGYRKPPRHTRFQKGRSGNPKGRRKGSKNVATLLEQTLRERVVVTENGKRKTITKLEAMLKQLANKAAAGDHRAIRLLMPLAQTCLASSQSPAYDAPAPVPEPLTKERKAYMRGVFKVLEESGYFDDADDAAEAQAASAPQAAVPNGKGDG